MVIGSLLLLYFTQQNAYNYNKIRLVQFVWSKAFFISLRSFRIIDVSIFRYIFNFFFFFFFLCKEDLNYDARKCWQNVCTISILSPHFNVNLTCCKRYERWVQKICHYHQQLRLTLEWKQNAKDNDDGILADHKIIIFFLPFFSPTFTCLIKRNRIPIYSDYKSQIITWLLPKFIINLYECVCIRKKRQKLSYFPRAK